MRVETNLLMQSRVKKKKKTKPKYTLQIRQKNKNSKRNTTLEVKTSIYDIYGSQQSGDVSPTPST
jgi:hypothetical protein